MRLGILKPEKKKLTQKSTGKVSFSAKPWGKSVKARRRCKREEGRRKDATTAFKIKIWTLRTERQQREGNFQQKFRGGGKCKGRRKTQEIMNGQIMVG